MNRKQSTKKGGTQGKAEGSKRKRGELVETLDKAAIDYAQKAYDAALSHYCANQRNPFALSRLAVVYGETQPGDFHMVVTLPGILRDSSMRDEDIREYVRAAESVARTLEDPECSEAYRRAFVGIYTDHLLNISRTNWEHPAAIRFLIPLVMLDLWGNRPADADTALAILSMTLRDALNSDEVTERTRVGRGERS